MESGQITRAIRSSNRTFFLHFIVIAILLAIVVFATSNYLYNFFAGPFEVTQDEVLAHNPTGAITDKSFITLNDTEILDTGYEYYTVDNAGNETTEQSYGALFVGDKLLLVESNQLIDESAMTHTGELVTVSADVRREVIEDIERDVPELKGFFLPYMLKKADFRLPGYIGLVIGGLIALYGLVALYWATTRSGNQLSHPIMKKLARYGEPEMVAENIESELTMKSREVGRLVHTKSWVIYQKGATFHAIAAKDLMWAYKKVVTRKKYGVTVGKTYSAHIWDRHGVEIQFTAKESEVDASLTSVAERAPWMLMGYDDKLQAEWNKNRASVIEAVNHRHQLYQTQAAQQPA